MSAVCSLCPDCCIMVDLLRTTGVLQTHAADGWLPALTRYELSFPSTVASQIQAQASRLMSQTAGAQQDQGRRDAALAAQFKPMLSSTAMATLAVLT